MIRTASCGLVLVVAAGVGSSQSGGAQQSIRGVIAAGAKVEVVRGGFHRLEGPVRTENGGLYFSDVDENRTYVLDASGQIAIWRENTQGANGLFLLRNGNLLAAEASGRRVVMVTPDRQSKPVATECGGKPLVAPNDLIPDRRGGIYFTDPGPRYPPNVAPTALRNTCYARPDGKVLLLDNQMVYPNGITLSLDEKTLFVDDSFGEYVYAFDVQSDGRVLNKREFVKLREPEQWPGWGLRSRADGMAIDAKGRLYVATASGVQVIDPRGKYLGTIRVPSIARNLAFGGASRQTLYMTGLESLMRVEMSSSGPPGRAK